MLIVIDSHEYDDEQTEFLKDTYKWQKPMKVRNINSTLTHRSHDIHWSALQIKSTISHWRDKISQTFPPECRNVVLEATPHLMIQLQINLLLSIKPEQLQLPWRIEMPQRLTAIETRTCHLISIYGVVPSWLVLHIKRIYPLPLSGTH